MASVVYPKPPDIPSQTSHEGKFLTTDGTNPSWTTITVDPLPQIFMMMGA